MIHRRMMSLWLVVGVALAATIATAGYSPSAFAQADPRVEAKAAYARGKQAYEVGRYAVAIDEFRRADQLAPSGVNDFNIGLAYQALGENEAAVRAYESYLSRMPDAPNRAAVESTIAALRAAPPVAPPPSVPGTAAAAAPGTAAGAAPGTAAGGGPGDGATTPGSGDLPPLGPGDVKPPQASYEPTGDAELDRVASVDLAAVREQRLASGMPAPVGAAPAEPEAQGGPPMAPPQPEAKPVYKKWWFWVLLGVGAYVVVSIAVADSGTDTVDDGFQRLMPAPGSVASSSSSGAGGMTLLSW